MAKKQNKFLTFLLGDESFGIAILKVKEIIGMQGIIHVPKMPHFVKGVINLRGKIIPVIDLRLKFSMENRDYDDRTCIIVVEIATPHGGKLNGLVVDIVSEVQDIPEENIEEAPSYGSSVEEEFLAGMGKVKDRVIMLIDTDRIFDDNDKLHLDSAAKLHITNEADVKEDNVKEYTLEEKEEVLV